jgi:futalosine hydrolase
MIALLCSVPLEANRLLAFITAVEAFPLGSKTFFRGALSDQEVALCTGGMGKANAAHAAALLITRFNPGALIIFGVGGAYPSSGAKIGDIVLASEEIAGDEGVLTPEGFRDTKYIGIPLIQSDGLKFYNRFPAPEDLLKKARKRLSRSQPARSLHAGSFVTVSTCTGTASRARELEARYGGLCENMEGAAAAQVARLHGVPWLEVRGISNMVEDRDMKKWDVPRAALAVQQAVEQILEGWKE